MVRPLRRHRTVSVVTSSLLFVAFILFLLVALSLPIIKPIYILSLNAQVADNQPATSIATEVRFGIWGFCATSVLNPPTWFTNHGDCFGPRLGYSIDPNTQLGADILALTDYPKLVNAVSSALTVILVLHPITAVLSFLCVFTSLFLESHFCAILSLVVAVVTSLLSSVVFAIDLAIVLVAMDQIKDVEVGTFTIGWGNAVWMVLAGMVLTWCGVVALSARACYCCGVRPANGLSTTKRRKYF